MNSDSERVRRIYDSIADAYDAKRKNPAESQWNDFLESPAMERVVRPLCAGADVLDLGCGTGILSRELLAWGAKRVWGVDPSERMLALARREVPEVTFAPGTAEAIPHDDATFDLVASSLVLHYVRDLAPAFAEVRRVLRPGGHFVFSMHHPLGEVLSRDANEPARVIAEPYFHNDEYRWQMCKTDIISFHHTFADVVNGLAANGFVLRGVDECRPDPSVEGDFATYGFTSRYPNFCVFWAGG